MTDLYIFQIVVLLFSVVIHEVAHGYVAFRLGDPTAHMLGRLTLNPIRHIDIVGSIIVPLVLIVMKAGIVFGWAKPVPFNPNNLKNPLRDGALIAVFGPISNIMIALVFGLLFRLFGVFGGDLAFSGYLSILLAIVVQVNISLALFNLLPIPPLDGSKLLYAVMGDERMELINKLEAYGFFILILVLMSGVLSFIYPVIRFSVNGILGVELF